MASIDLTGLPLNRAEPQPYRAGGVQEGALGGALLQVNRLGDRWSFSFTSSLMLSEPVGRRWQAALDAAESAGAIMAIEQRGFDVGALGAPVVAANTASGKLVPITGLTPGYAIRTQWMSIVSGGRRYLDKILTGAIADASGNATVTIKNLLRAPLLAGDLVELAQPKIEGILGGNYSAPIELDHSVIFGPFTITEVR